MVASVIEKYHLKDEQRWCILTPISVVHMNPSFREHAIALRRKGFSYSEILTTVPVAKSTLALWLRSVGLSQKQKQRITQKRIDGARRGAAKKKQVRIEKTNIIKHTAKKEARRLINNHLWLTGTALYWGEGEKEKPWRPSSRVTFSNMDVHAHKIFLRWTRAFLKVPKKLFTYALFIHENADTKKALDFWSDRLRIPVSKIIVYHKKDTLKTTRGNKGDDYNGVLMIRIHKSSDLNRRIAGWIEYVVESLT